MIFLCNLCPAFVSFFSRLNHKICVPRLLVTVRVLCLLHTASKCSQTYHVGAKKWYDFFLGGGREQPLLRASPILVSHPLTKIQNTPLIEFVRPAQNEAVHKSTTYNNKLYNIQQSIQNQTSASARCSPAIRRQLNLCTAPRLPLQGQHFR